MSFEEFPVLNQDLVGQLKELAGGNEEIVKQLFVSFSDDAQQLINKINSSYNNESYDALQVEVHTLKGLCGTIGASKLHEILKALDLQLKADNEQVLDQYMGVMNSQYLTLKTVIAPFYN